MAKFYVVGDGTGTLAEGVTAEGVTAAQVDKLLRKGRARIDVSPVHAMVEPVSVEISPSEMADSMSAPAAPAIRQKAGETVAKVETSSENAAALKAALKKDEAAKAAKAKATAKKDEAAKAAKAKPGAKK